MLTCCVYGFISICLRQYVQYPTVLPLYIVTDNKDREKNKFLVVRTAVLQLSFISHVVLLDAGLLIHRIQVLDGRQSIIDHST